MFVSRLAIASTAIAATLVPATAHALPSRIWVSVSGTDTAGCGPATTPCRTFQYAHDNIADGGEIDVKEPGGYGTINITKPVSVVNDGVGSATIQAAAGNAVTVNLGVDGGVYLKGLSIDGTGGGVNGIAIGTANHVTIRDCTIRRFIGAGIRAVYVSGRLSLTVLDTMSTDNGTYGLFFGVSTGATGGSLLIERSAFLRNSARGIHVSQQATAAVMQVAISDSTTAQNNSTGIGFDNVSGSTFHANVRHVLSLGNSFGSGIIVNQNVEAVIGQSQFIENGNYGLANLTSPNTVFSLGDNLARNNNTANINGSVPAAISQF